MSTVIQDTKIAVDAYATPEALINAILASGDFNGDKIAEYLGSRLATLAAVKVLDKRLKEMAVTLIPEANVEFINLQKHMGQKQPRAYGVSFKHYPGSTRYSFTEVVAELERELKNRKEFEKKEGLATKEIKPPSNGANFSVVM